eukprot:354076-Chlamydomonas_euryale.AAC.2
MRVQPEFDQGFIKMCEVSTVAAVGVGGSRYILKFSTVAAACVDDSGSRSIAPAALRRCLYLIQKRCLYLIQKRCLYLIQKRCLYLIQNFAST